MQTRRRSFLAAVAAAFVLSLVPATRAAVIGVNFTTGRSAAEVNAVTGPAGVVAQSNFNNVASATGSGGPVPLVDDSNLATTAVLSSFTSANNYSTFGSSQADQNQQLLNSYIDNNGTTPSEVVTVTGVPYATYDVIAYVGSDGNGRTGHATIGATSFYYSTNSNQGAFPGFTQGTATTLAGAAAANYVRFTNLSGSTFTLTNTRDSNNTGLTAFQIVNTSVPEPASLGLLGLGGLGLLARRRKA